MDLGCVQNESHSEHLEIYSEDRYNERSIGARSTITSNLGSSKTQVACSDSTRSDCHQSAANLDLCELFISSESNSNKALSAHSDSQDEDKLVDNSLSCFIADEDDSSFAESESGK